MAEKQHGVVTWAQLLAAGLGADAIEHRVATGRLNRVHRGVYLLGPGLEVPLAPEMGALLACGPGAVLSHRSAATLWELITADAEPVEVTVVAGDRRPPGVHTHRTRYLDSADRRVRRGIPLTAPARTLLDLAAAAAPRDLERAYEQALVLNLMHPKDLEAAWRRMPNARGAKSVRALLRAARDPALTRSEAERRLVELIRATGLPRPAVNVALHGFEVDFYWPEERLVVEVDGYAFHRTRAAFERDRQRDATLQLAGQCVLRVTWRRIIEEPYALVAQLTRALGRS